MLDGAWELKLWIGLLEPNKTYQWLPVCSQVRPSSSNCHRFEQLGFGIWPGISWQAPMKEQDIRSDGADHKL